MDIRFRRVRKNELKQWRNAWKTHIEQISPFYDPNKTYLRTILRKRASSYLDRPDAAPYWILLDGKTIGFFLVERKPLRSNADHVLSAFSIFPDYQERGFGEAIIGKVFGTFPGIWQLKYNPNDERAARFWRKVTRSFRLIIMDVNCGRETMLWFRTDRYRGIREHAILYGLFGKYIKIHCSNPEEIIRTATELYGNNRGMRMAKYASKAECPQGIYGYLLCGEWRGFYGDNISCLTTTDEETISTVTKCAWHKTWVEEDLEEEGRMYCKYIDQAITAGFGNGLGLKTPQSMGEGDDRCVFVWNQPHDPDRLEELRHHVSTYFVQPFSWHCKDLIDTFRTVLNEKEPALTDKIIDEVMYEFETRSGSLDSFY